MGKINSFYLVIGITFVTLLTVNTRYFKGSNAFLGVTYAKKYQINSEKPATVIETYIVPGQTVNIGDLLVELESPELELEIKKLEKEILNLQSEKVEKQKLLESKIELLKSEINLIRNEVKNEIERIDARIQLNESLTEGISNNRSTTSDSLSELQLQKKSIQEKGTLEIESINIRMNDVLQDHEFDQSQVQATIELRQQELNWRLQEQEKLNKYAVFDGVIDNVNVKPGEQVEAYSSLLSINPVQPTTVIGYLVGSKDRSRSLGDVVTIQSMEQSNLSTQGTIIGFGSVTMLPQILQKSTAVNAFGLEVFIEVDAENPLPVGEKVMIK
ncbi:MAG: biotin/lipoyl-binding protein [Balneolaceae bacterium]|nr:biotin/lipoyl-binding protein [Balneolaceae bacterium]